MRDYDQIAHDESGRLSTVGRVRASLSFHDVAAPEQLHTLLTAIADACRESEAELQANWGDRGAGLVWGDFARILDRAAIRCEKARNKHGV